MSELTWHMLYHMRNVAIERRRHPIDRLPVSSERYDKMMCEICKSDPTLCSEADRKRLEDEKWEQRRYEIARDILPAIYRMEFTAPSRDAICGYAIRYADELIKRLKAST